MEKKNKQKESPFVKNTLLKHKVIIVYWKMIYCAVTENSDFVAKKNNFGSKIKIEKILGIRWEGNNNVLILGLKEL